MKEPHWKEFITAMMKEVTYHMDNGKYSIKPKSHVTTVATILLGVCQMNIKQDIKTRAIKKWKERLNIDGYRTKKWIHYEQTYAHVASWNSMQLLLTL